MRNLTLQHAITNIKEMIKNQEFYKIVLLTLTNNYASI